MAWVGSPELPAARAGCAAVAIAGGAQVLVVGGRDASHTASTSVAMLDLWWAPTAECHRELCLPRARAAVVTILLVGWRLQWQVDPALVPEHTRKVARMVALPTLPSEIWFEILRFVRVDELGR